MKTNHTIRRIPCRTRLHTAFFVLLLASLAATPILAQDASDKDVHTIEVCDGEIIAFGDDFHGSFAFGDLFDRARNRSGGGADFTVRNGNFARYFADESEDHGPFMFRFGNDPLIGSLGDAFPSAEVMKLEQKARRLAQRIRQADGDVSQLEDELDETLGRIFGLKMESRAERVEGLESRLQELRDRINQRETDREMIIEQRKQDLLGRHGRYEW